MLLEQGVCDHILGLIFICVNTHIFKSSTALPVILCIFFCICSKYCIDYVFILLLSVVGANIPIHQRKHSNTSGCEPLFYILHIAIQVLLVQKIKRENIWNKSPLSMVFYFSCVCPHLTK